MITITKVGGYNKTLLYPNLCIMRYAIIEGLHCTRDAYQTSPIWIYIVCQTFLIV